MKIKISKEDVAQITVTTCITVIVGLVGFMLFDLNCGVYAAITSGLSIGVGKEYADSLSSQDKWSWRDVITGSLGAVIGLVICLIFYLIR